MTCLYLASSSPRRAELLQQIGVPFKTLVSPVDETPWPQESAASYVERLAIAKAEATLLRLEGVNACVLGSDTCVVLDGNILGKPTDQEDAFQMLSALSGRAHQVLTAVAILNAERRVSQVVSSTVHFMPLSAEQISAYWQTGEPQDKAGAYGIQGMGAVFVERIEGSYSAVVGLHLHEVAQLLKGLGASCWAQGFQSNG